MPNIVILFKILIVDEFWDSQIGHTHSKSVP